MVQISATGSNMAGFSHTYDLGMTKASSPPSITISMGEWIGENYELTGNFNDPDGDVVTITATNNQNMWGTILTSGNQWMANGAGIPNSDTNTIVLTACDSWNECSTVTHEAGATPGQTPDNGGSGDDDGGGGSAEAEEEGLPGFGIFAALGAIALAGIGQRRQE